ncbi:MAG: UDP-N-acetylglucosamine--N-acetylmuramyl-(pentapeptide) pyrophosphoryl-undecaprenol N-acetylglucosamine transferase, partial [Lachnospiraceae bacterium]|nr:UDP-N-acetylglucosamine--N-acetylmuramyl-(pentapeptide) pyrophosphoryl-undecaprenol N-acetylglucosamine transferase [Lachnospiraceae bacterium]
DPALDGIAGYVQFGYIKTELSGLLNSASLIISRAGANAICEILALQKPNILIPLPATQSRGDQLLNAASFEKQGFSYVIMEEDLTDELLLKSVEKVINSSDTYITNMKNSPANDAIKIIVGLIEDAAKK